MSKGKKFDKGKLRWDLLPFREVEQIVDILTFGAEKYEPNNWQKVETERYEAALMRHFSAYKQGEGIDAESKRSHLALLACNVLFLLYKENEGNK